MSCGGEGACAGGGAFLTLWFLAGHCLWEVWEGELGRDREPVGSWLAGMAWTTRTHNRKMHNSKASSPRGRDCVRPGAALPIAYNAGYSIGRSQ